MNSDTDFTRWITNNFIELERRRRWTAFATMSSSNVILRRQRRTSFLPHFYTVQNTRQTRSVNLFSQIQTLLLITPGKRVKKHVAITSLCDCGASEETAVHFFRKGKNYNEFRPQKVDKLNLLCKDDCGEMEKFIVETKKLNRLFPDDPK